MSTSQRIVGLALVLGVAAAPSSAVAHVPEPGANAHHSPGLAAALSLNPFPLDLGNFYAENVGWGVVYTTVEAGLAGGMMWMGGAHGCHDGDDCGDWSDRELGLVVGLGAGYVLTKVVAALHAASAVHDMDQGAAPSGAWLAPAEGGVAFGWRLEF